MRSNLVKSKTLLTLVSGALLWCFQSVAADTIIPINQARSVTIILIVPCGGGTYIDQDAAEGFEPFDSMIEMLIDCDSGLGFAAASQQSQIDPNSITASGTSASEALAPVQTLIHAIGHSNFSVTFELESESQFTVEGLLSAESLDDPIGMLFAATLSLRDANYQAIFHWIVEPGPDGAPNSQVIEEFGLLEPGVYTMRAQAVSLIDNDVPPDRSGEASFDFVFMVEMICVADLDGDGTVDASDLAELLGSWGKCAGCPADLDGDGEVGPFDLALLLGAWGPCPG